ncbi:MAG: hypothetical protein FD149_2640, partial [Rhodospirillaceae bacterium]
LDLLPNETGRLPDEADRLPAFFTTTRSFFREAAELVLAEPPQSWI